MRDNKMEYEIAVASALVDEAAEFLRGMKNWLIKNYAGQETRAHFGVNAKSSERTWKVMPMKRKLDSTATNWDDDVESFFNQANTQDKISRVLIEGMDKLLNEEQQKKETEKGSKKKEEPNQKNEKTQGKKGMKKQMQEKVQRKKPLQKVTREIATMIL